MNVNDKVDDKKIDHNAVYFKNNKDCEYVRILSGVAICSWNNMVCRRVPYSLCAKYDEPIKENAK